MVSGNVLYMTRELGGFRGWAGETEGVDRSLLGRPWQGSSGGSGQVVRADGSCLEVTWKATQGGGQVGVAGIHQPCDSGQSMSPPPKPVSPSATWYISSASPI